METVFEKFKQLEVSGNYRGVVIDNTGEMGRCKIFIPSIYPDEFINQPINLPWAEPAMPIAGGSYKTLPPFVDKSKDEQSVYRNQTGINKVPKIGSHVWVFFENNNHNYPVYWAAINGGDGWFSENEYQYVYKSDNVFLRIDEHPNLVNKRLVTDNPNYMGEDELRLDSTKMDSTQTTPTFKSSSYFTTFNSNNIETVTTKPKVEEKVPTRIELNIIGNVQLVINGNVNLQIQGNTYAEYCGNVYETVKGDKYEKIKGNYYLEVDKDFKELIGGVHEETVNKDVTEFYKGKYSTTVTDSVTETYMSSYSNTTTGSTNIKTSSMGITSSSVSMSGTLSVSLTMNALNVTANLTKVSLATHMHPTAALGPPTPPTPGT